MSIKMTKFVLKCQFWENNWFAELMKNEWMNSISGFLDELKNEYHVVKLYFGKKTLTTIF